MEVRRSRRSLLGAIVGVVSGTVAASLAGVQRVMAAGDDGKAVVVGGNYLDVQSETWMINNVNDRTVFRAGNSRSGVGIEAFSFDGAGVQASSPRGTAVRASANNHVAVAADSNRGTGVWATHGRSPGRSPGYPAAIMAESDDENGPAVIGNNYATTGHGHGVQGLSDSPQGWATLGWARAKGTALTGVSAPDFPTNQVPPNTGVFGFASQGRGGVFRGATAQVRLIPSTAASHPASGAAGDLFMDSRKRLWFCKGGTTWKQIA